tara:strand:+ start:83 stop:295 length:213 start_codon:yes stop_codon:yes gene_type:complete
MCSVTFSSVATKRSTPSSSTTLGGNPDLTEQKWVAQIHFRDDNLRSSHERRDGNASRLELALVPIRGEDR